MTLQDQTCEDWIALCEAPAHTDLFFLGSEESRITFYSQQVRAFNLVHSLHRRGRLAENDRVAVVGAGAAGVTAALALACVGARVQLYERSEQALILQKNSPRMLHPRIYDWPLPGALTPSADLPLLTWGRATASQVSADFVIELDKAVAVVGPKLKVRKEATVTALRHDAAQWRLASTSNGAVQPEGDFDKVFLTIGFGEERLIDAAPRVNYWARTNVALVAGNQANYFLSGTGDGGLIDMLGILIDGFDHLEFTEEFLELFRGPRLADAVREAEGAIASKGDLRPAFEAHVLPVLTGRGVVEALEPRIVRDRLLTWNRQAPLLAKGAAARLNQVMAYALMEAAAHRGGNIVRYSEGDVTAVSQIPNHRYRVNGPVLNGLPVNKEFDAVILHHGPDRAKRYAPFATYHDAYRAHREHVITNKPNLAEPPRLHPETFDFFYERYARFCDVQSRAARGLLRDERRHTIVLGVDAASGALIQQGLSSLEELFDPLENLAHHYNIRLAAPSGAFYGMAKALVRLARASNGRILLSATDPVQQDWRQLMPTIQVGPILNMPFEPRNLPTADNLLAAIDACLLRLLDVKLTAVFDARRCPAFGPIHPTIINAIANTWTTWRQTLNAQVRLRTDFLRLLGRVEQDGQDPWDGDHGSLDRLTAALVLMLATHIGERLTPDLCSPGNLLFSARGVALGSGCATIGGAPIEMCEDPEAWSVDALILSEAKGSMFEGTLDLIGDAGVRPTSLERAARVVPAVIQNSRSWRQYLGGDVAEWRSAVEAEFAKWRHRQDEQMAGVE